MQASYYRSQLDGKLKSRADAEKKLGEHRRKEAEKRAAAAKARSAAAKSKNASTVRIRLSEAERCEKQANTAARAAASWGSKAAKLSKEAADLQAKLARAEQAEQKRSTRRATATQRAIDSRLEVAEEEMASVLKELRAPKPEKLRVLLLGASPAGDLRVGREQAEIRRMVEGALHRDRVELDTHPAATVEHLLDGLSKFRPHVVHFSGHSESALLTFEQDRDELHAGANISAKSFVSAVTAVDEPPELIVLNSCHSAAQIEYLTSFIPFAIGMADKIDDKAAVKYAARFYASVANGQSIQAAHALGRVAIDTAGLPTHELPTLRSAPGFEAADAFLVKPLQ